MHSCLWLLMWLAVCPSKLPGQRPVRTHCTPPSSRCTFQALQSDPSADAHEALARAYIKGERYLEAAEAALKAITVDAGLAKAYLRRG
jgi:hypothetical protein